MAFYFYCLAILHECLRLPRHFLPYLCFSDLPLIRRGATRWGNLGVFTLFAEATRCQLEYKWLAKVTGRAEYHEKVRLPFNATDGLFVHRWFDNGAPLGGMLFFVFLISSQLTNPTHFIVRATADSGYEYFLKQYLLTGDQRTKTQWTVRAWCADDTGGRHLSDEKAAPMGHAWGWAHVLCALRGGLGLDTDNGQRAKVGRPVEGVRRTKPGGGWCA